MDHNEIRHALSEYLDGSLPPADQSIVEEHLKTCASCADALAELRKTIEQVKSLDQVEPPAWMTQKIMARVREEDAKKKSVWRYWFFPFRFPIETVGVVLLAVTAFFIYKNTQPVDRFSELSPGTEAPAPAQALKQEPAKDNAAPAPRVVPQKPGYKALDMKQEYESPPPPVQEAKKGAAGPPVTPGPKSERAPIALAKSGQGAHTAVPTKDSTQPPDLAAQREHSAEPSDKISAMHAIETIIVERYQDGSPKLIETYILVDSRKVKHTEERFNDRGLRNGIQKDFYPSGKIRTEAEYDSGKLVWYREFQADGVKKIGKSDFDWYWLKK